MNTCGHEVPTIQTHKSACGLTAAFLEYSINRKVRIYADILTFQIFLRFEMWEFKILSFGPCNSIGQIWEFWNSHMSNLRKILEVRISTYILTFRLREYIKLLHINKEDAIKQKLTLKIYAKGKKNKHSKVFTWISTQLYCT